MFRGSRKVRQNNIIRTWRLEVHVMMWREREDSPSSDVAPNSLIHETLSHPQHAVCLDHISGTRQLQMSNLTANKCKRETPKYRRNIPACAGLASSVSEACKTVLELSAPTVSEACTVISDFTAQLIYNLLEGYRRALVWRVCRRFLSSVSKPCRQKRLNGFVLFLRKLNPHEGISKQAHLTQPVPRERSLW